MMLSYFIKFFCKFAMDMKTIFDGPDKSANDERVNGIEPLAVVTAHGLDFGFKCLGNINIKFGQIAFSESEGIPNRENIGINFRA